MVRHCCCFGSLIVLVLLIGLFVVCRCDDDPGVGGGARHGLVGAGVRGVGAARAALLPNPTYGAHGPARRHLEAARLRRLCTSTGYSFSTKQKVTYLRLKNGIFD